MKRLVALLVALLVAVMLMLMPATPALAFGISPATVEFDVPADGSTTQTFTVYDFTGDVEISLEDIPLRVEPTTVAVAAGDEGTQIELTFYGDETLGSQVYNGYVRFLGMTGGTIATGIKVRAKVNHTVAGQPLPEETQPEEAPQTPQAEAGSFPVIPVAGIAAGAAIVITLIVVLVRRPRY